MSVILINAQNGSRTIVHHRGAMPEISLVDFKQNVALEEFSWIHFEGRTKSGERPHVNDIMQYLIEQRKQHGYTYKLSIELEKTYEGLKDLAVLADVVFVSKEFSDYVGSKTPEGKLYRMSRRDRHAPARHNHTLVWHSTMC